MREEIPDHFMGAKLANPRILSFNITLASFVVEDIRYQNEEPMKYGHRGIKAFGIVAFCLCNIIFFLVHPAHGQTESSKGLPWCGTAWACNAASFSGSPVQGEVADQRLFAAYAIGSAAKVGFATGQASADAAENLALSNCAANNGNQACEISKTTVGCIGIADRPGGGVSFWDSPKATRVDAYIHVLKICGATGCRVETTACADDDPRVSPPLPLPPGLVGGRVDPATVGTWELPMHPGRWIWQIAANGTYELHIEAPDGGESQAGKYVSNAGVWTLDSIAGNFATDGGTYIMQGPDTMVVTGKLGTGVWQRVMAPVPVVSLDH